MWLKGGKNIQFHDEEIDNLQLDSVADFNKLITVYLCGRKSECSLNEQEERMVKSALVNIQKNKMSFEQLNEVLLLMSQSRIGHDFFTYFFDEDVITLQELKKGIVKFRGYTMLRFGNFRFGFKELLAKNECEIDRILEPFSKKDCDILPFFTLRPEKILDISSIDRELISYVGELSGRVLRKEEDFWTKDVRDAKRRKDKKKFEELLEIKNQLQKRKKATKNVEKQALENADIYLTWDCMDVYIATSMRNKWEYLETYDFVRTVFADTTLQRLNLRYFDPTQSKCNNAREKGLIEGLMLKRCLCAIYMAQEGDTIGKDSELAATLAQSKPVIAYVPQHNFTQYATEIASYPLDFFKTRLQILNAEGTLKDSDCGLELKKIDRKFQDLIDLFLEQLDDFQVLEPYTLEKTEQKFKSKFKKFKKICSIVSAAECFNYEKRAKILNGLHPLCMQVNLDSGVTNGVLVVRNPRDCALLLNNLLTNNMDFVIKKSNGSNILEEQISKCAYRAITDNDKLANCFWNFFSKT